MVKFRREQREALHAGKLKRRREMLPGLFQEQGFTLVAQPEAGPLTVERADLGRVQITTLPDGYHLKSASGHSNTLTLDDFGRVQRISDGGGASATFQFNRDGSIRETDRGSGGVIKTPTNCKGLLTSYSDACDRTTTFQHNQDGRLIKVTDRNGGEKHYDYDAQGRVVLMVDAKGARTGFGYTHCSHPSKVYLPNGVVHEYCYSAEGALEAWLIDDEQQAVYHTDPNENTRSAEYKDGSRATIQLANGHLCRTENENADIQFQTDDQGRLLAEITGEAQITLTRNPAGDLIEQVNAAGTVRCEYDNDGRLITMIDWDGGTYTFSYDAHGALAKVVYPNRVSHQQENNEMGFPVSSRHETANGHCFGRRRWAYDLSDRLTLSHENDLTRHFDYLAEGALQAVTTDQPLWCETFARDAVGNALSDDNHEYQYDAADQLIAVDDTTTEHDCYGNLCRFTTPNGETAQARFSARNHLIELEIADQRIRYRYDGLGRRIEKTVAGTTTRYQWAGLRLIAETQIDDAGRQSHCDYLYCGEGIQPVAMRRDGHTYYLHFGRRGETVAATDKDGHVVWQATYTAFGQAVCDIADINQPFRLAGQYHDPESGLSYALSRYYHPGYGRFLSRDPLFCDGGAGNLYLYCKGDPLNAADPTGAFIIPVAFLVGAAVTFTIGAVIGGGIEVASQLIEHGAVKDWSAVGRETLIGGGLGLLSGGVGAAVRPLATRGLIALTSKVGPRVINAAAIVIAEASALIAEICADNAIRGQATTWEDFASPWNYVGYALEPIGKYVRRILPSKKADDLALSNTKTTEDAVEAPKGKGSENPTDADTVKDTTATPENGPLADDKTPHPTTTDADRLPIDACGDVGCNNIGEPIAVVSGCMFHRSLDFENGPFKWERTYRSGHAALDSPLGFGFHHGYARRFFVNGREWCYVTQSGLVQKIGDLFRTGSRVAVAGFQFVRTSLSHLEVCEPDGTRLEFLVTEDRRHGRLVGLTDQTGTLAFTYNACGWLTEISARAPGDRKATLYRLSRLGRHISDILMFPPGCMIPETICRYSYNEAGCMVAFRDVANAVADYGYNADGRMTELGNRNGYYFYYSYDAEGRCVRCRGEDGKYAVTLTYSPAERQTQVRYDDGACWTFSYDAAGTITGLTDPTGGHMDRLLDRQGRATREIGPGSRDHKLLYDGVGRHTGARDGLGHNLPPRGTAEPSSPSHLADLPDTAGGWQFGKLVARYSGNEAHPSDPVLARQNWFLDRLLRQWLQRTEEEERAAQKRFPARYDSHRRPIVWYEDGLRESRYDAEGNPTHLRDRDGFETQFHYSSWNFVTTREDGEGRCLQYDYTIRGLLAQVVDGGGLATSYEYDHANRLVAVNRAGALVERYDWNEAGQLVDKFDAGGQRLLHCEYDEHGHLIQREIGEHCSHSFAYDAENRLSGFAVDDTFFETPYDAAGRAVGETREGRGIHHEFDNQGRLVQTRYFDQWSVDYDFHEDGTLQIRDPQGRTHRLFRGSGGLFHRETADGGNELTRFDKHGRCVLKRCDTRRQSVSHSLQRLYYYSAEGDLLECDDSLLGKQQYRYDRAHRLVETILAGAESERFRYDSADNMLEAPHLSDAKVSETNRLTRANGWFFTYNTRGAMHSRGRDQHEIRYRYDAFDQLVEIEGLARPWRAAYDPLGRRMWKQFGNIRTDYYWDGARLAAERHHNGALRLYIYPDTAALVPMLIVDLSNESTDATASVYTVYTDHLGAPVLIRDEQGRDQWFARYDAYGQAHIDSSPLFTCNLRRPGSYCDEETGLYYNRYRYYDPTLGRFIQPDPIGLAGGINLYAYSATPLSAVDLLGLNADLCGGVDTQKHKDDGQPGKPQTEQVPNPRPADDPVRVYRNVDLSKMDKAYIADPRLIVEMPFVGKDSSGGNAAGFKRNASYYWKEVMKKNREFFSKANQRKIDANKPPTNDKTFRKYFPQFDKPELHDEELRHHHVGGGGQAVGIPESLHPGFGGVHTAEKELGIWGRDNALSDVLERLRKQGEKP